MLPSVPDVQTYALAHKSTLYTRDPIDWRIPVALALKSGNFDVPDFFRRTSRRLDRMKTNIFTTGKDRLIAPPATRLNCVAATICAPRS